jgi:Kef-type K+ transport system membrane component KefB
MRLDQAPTLVLALAVIVVVARAFGTVARRLGQPVVIGEILGGILLGPTLFGGAVTNALFPAAVRPPLAMLANVGVCVFMFLVGLELNRDLLRGQARIAASVAITAMLLPFGLGAALALYLVGRHPTDHRLGFVLFLGTAMAITAFPVLARILTDKGLIHTPIGGLALASAAVGDVLAWSVLAVAAALVADGSADPWRVLLVLPFAALLLGLVRPQLARLAARPVATGRVAGTVVLAAVGVGLLLSSVATAWMGLHPIFGAFLFGVAMPRNGGAALRRRSVPWIERICSILLLPVFFAVAGIKVDLSAANPAALGELALILLVAIVGKFAGGFLGARVNGVRPRHATVLGILINTRGLTELIVLTVGLQLGALDTDLYSLMVTMALVTTAMTGVLLRLVYPPHRVQQDLAAHDDAIAARRHAPDPKDISRKESAS